MTSPKAFTTTSAPTITPPGRLTAQVPTPPFIAVWGPNTLPTVAPLPAPTLPSSTGPADAPRAAAQPISAVGRTVALPIIRAKITAAGTTETFATAASNPI